MSKEQESYPQVLDNIEDYLRARYSDYGHSIADGFNCWTLLIHLIKQVHGVEFPDPEYELGTREDGGEVFRQMFEKYNMYDWVDDVDIKDVRYGDIITMRDFGLSPMTYHVGMFIGNREVIHIMKCGVVIHKLERLQRYIVGIHRVKVKSK